MLNSRMFVVITVLYLHPFRPSWHSTRRDKAARCERQQVSKQEHDASLSQAEGVRKGRSTERACSLETKCNAPRVDRARLRRSQGKTTKGAGVHIVVKNVN